MLFPKFQEKPCYYYTVYTTTTNSLSQDYTNLDDHISQTSIDIWYPYVQTIYFIILPAENNVPESKSENTN